MGGPSVPPSYKPANTGFADTSTTQNLGLQNQAATTGSNLANNVVNNPYAANVIPGAQQAGQYLTGTLAPQLQSDSSALSGAAGAAIPAGSSLLQTGFDPQNALYARTAQQVTDAQNAALARSGVANTPYGAGVAGQTAANFNIDWQNNQLNRQLQALSGYDSNLGAVGQAQGRAGELGLAGAGAETTGSALPYNTYNQMQGAGLGALGEASGLAGNAARTGQGYLNYDNAAYQNQLGQYNAENQGWQDMWSGLGSILSFGSGSGGGLGMGALSLLGL